MLKEKLKLLKLLDEINIEFIDGDYKISLKDYDEDYKQICLYIGADGKVNYYMSDLYNNSCDQEEIDIERLTKLQEVLKELTKD